MGNTCFILGAGFTADVSEQQFPLMNELLDALKITAPDVYDEYQFAEDNNIETSFTRIDIDIMRGNGNELEDKKIELINKIEKLFSMSGKNLKNNLQSNIFLDCLSNKDMILTTNYECYLENLLGYDRWSFHGGYGNALNYGGVQDPQENEKKMGIVIYKIHGSLSFKVVESYNNLDDKDVEISLNKKEFPTFHSSLGWTTEKYSFLFLPSYIKIISYRNMFDHYREAISNIEKMSRLVIIGSKLRPEDYILWLILSYVHPVNIDVFIISPKANDIKATLIKTLKIQEEKIYTYSGKFSERAHNFYCDFKK